MKCIKAFLISYTVTCYLTCIFFFLPTALAVEVDSPEYDTFCAVLLVLYFLQILLLIVTIVFEVINFSKHTEWNNSKMTLTASIIKTVLIPVYFLNFIVGVIMFLMGFFTGFTWLIVPFVFLGSLGSLIITSGPNIKSIWHAKSNGILTTSEAVILTISQCLFVIDMPCSWVVFVRTK